jgi:hypothetical protein
MTTILLVPRSYYINREQEDAILTNLVELTKDGTLEWAYSDENDCDVFETHLKDADGTLVQLVCSRKCKNPALPEPTIMLYKNGGEVSVRLDPEGDNIKPLHLFNMLRSKAHREFVTKVSSYLSDTNDK